MGEPAEVPDVLTIEEASRVLRLGRTSIYRLARQWRDTGGTAGIPNIAYGNTLRVPRAQLEAQLGRPISHIPPAKSAKDQPKPTRAEEDEAKVRPIRRRPTSAPPQHVGASEQGALPL
jgi:hypothetical protein